MHSASVELAGVCPPRTAPLLDAGTGPVNPGRHPAGEPRCARRKRSISRGAGPELCRRAGHHGKERQGARSRVVPAHPELGDAFRSVPRDQACDWLSGQTSSITTTDLANHA